MLDSQRVHSTKHPPSLDELAEPSADAHVRPPKDTKFRNRNMPIEYSVSKNGLRIETYPRGVLDTEETMDYFYRLEQDKSIMQGSIEIVYFKFVTDFKISYLEGAEIAKRYQNPKTNKLIDKTIFVCETDLAFGIGRMLQTFHEITNPEHNVVVVKSDHEMES